MMNYRIMHVVEAMSGGVAHSINLITSGYCAEIPAYIVHGPREFNNKHAVANQNVQLIPWSVGREIAPLRDTRALIELIRIMRSISPTVVHAHSTKAGILARIAATI